MHLVYFKGNLVPFAYKQEILHHMRSWHKPEQKQGCER